MNRDLSLAIRLFADSRRMISGLRDGERGVSRFTSRVKREFAEVRQMLGSVTSKIAGLGLTVGTAAEIARSAKLDQSLTKIGQSAGVGQKMTAELRRELFAMAKQTGADIEALKEGDAALLAAGQSFKAAQETTKAVNVATAVTGSNAKILAGALTVAGEAFQFDLEKPKLAQELLDKMTMAGRLGNAELENLSDIFARIGVNSRSAGFGFSQTLAFLETLSLQERNPERLATLADSTLRLFNNLDYTKAPAKATGVRFFDAKGERRDAIAVLEDIRRQYAKLTTDKQRALFLDKAFGKADLDTIRGLKILLQGDSLAKLRQFAGQIDTAGGTLARDLPEAINNAVDQAGRLKATLREAADNFAQPINKAIADAIRYGLDQKKLTGEQIIGGGAAAVAGGLVAARIGKGVVGAIGGKAAGLAGGVATGKALEQAGVMPVYVVNMPSSGIGGKLSGAASMAGAAGAGAIAPKLALSRRSFSAR